MKKEKKAANKIHYRIIMFFMLTILVFTSGQPLKTEAASTSKLNKTAVTLNVGKTYRLKLSNTKKRIKWSSSKKSVAKVTSKGVVKAKKKGSATIIAKVGSKKYKCKVTVKQPAKSIKLNKKSATLKKANATIALKATVSPKTANNHNVKWTTSNKNVATVTSKGVVKAIQNGTCTITATTKDGTKKKAACKVSVNIQSTTIQEDAVKDNTITENTVTVKGITFDVSSFPKTLLVGNKLGCLSIVPKGTINPADITYKIGNGNAQLICDYNTPNLRISDGEFYEHEYYVSDWKNRMAYISTSYQPNMYVSYRVEIYNQIKTGSFPVNVYYKNSLIRTCTVTITSTNSDAVEYRNWMDDLEKKAWTDNMTTEEKLQAIKDYIYNNYSYITDGMRCNQGASALLYAARDLGLKARYRFVGPNYDYEKGYGDVYNHAGSCYCSGHVCTIITINGEDKVYEAQGHLW